MVVLMAIAVSISFATAAPFSKNVEEICRKYKRALHYFQKDTLHPKDRVLDTGDATVLVIGMGKWEPELTEFWSKLDRGKFLE